MGKKWWIIASLALGVVTVILLMSIYKTTDIAFVGEALVEDVAKAVGVETKKMKEERIEREVIEEPVVKEYSFEDLANMDISNLDSVQAYYNYLDSLSLAAEVKANTKDIITKEKPVTDIILASKKELENVRDIEETQKEAPEGLIVNKSFTRKNSVGKSLDGSSKQIVGAFPVESKEVNNNEYVQFRTANEIEINGMKIPKNTVFDAKVSFIGGKLIITALELSGNDVQLINNTHPIADFASSSNQSIILSQTNEIDFEL